jgi:hypothetical protein
LQEQLLTEGQETVASAAIPAFVSTNASPEASPNVSISEAGSSLNQPLLLEERLKRLLESEDVQESVSAAKSFLNHLGCAKLEDPNAATKAREQAAILEAYVTGDELETLKLLLAKLDSLPLLQQTTDQLTKAPQQQVVRHNALTRKNTEIREQLQKRRANITICD